MEQRLSILENKLSSISDFPNKNQVNIIYDHVHDNIKNSNDNTSKNYFNLKENENVIGIPSFNGGSSESSSPFNVDSSFLITNLNADLLDGHDSSYFQTALGFTPYNSTNPSGFISDGNTNWDNSYGFITSEIINDTIFSPTWDGDILHSPTKNSVYDAFGLYELSLPVAPENPETKYLNGNREWASVAIGAGGFAGNLYFSKDDSDVTGYKKFSYINDSTVTELSGTIRNQEVLLRTYLYDYELETDTIDAGVWVVNYNIRVSSNNGVTQLKFEAFVRHTDNSETTLFSDYSPELNNTSYTTIRSESNQPMFDVLETDRLGVRIYAKTTSNNNISIYTTIGDGDASYFTTPLRIRHNQLRDLNGDSNFLHVTEAEKNSFLTSISSDLGDGSAGPIVNLGRNTNETNSGAGSINFIKRDGTAGYVWQDIAGNLRINTSAPTTANDTAGVIVGSQTSTRSTKQDISDYLDYGDALSQVINAPLYSFRYINEVEGYGEDSPLAKFHIGFIADEVSEDFMSGNVIDQVSINGLLMASIKELNLKIENFNSEILSSSDSFDISIRSFLENISNGLNKIFSKEIYTEKICVKNSSEEYVCVTGDELEQTLNSLGIGDVIASPEESDPATL